ncbi:DUF502 domain-containing protein [Haloarchaeobius iranensis]|uniref:Uncharacterized membrane protein n=1 Tax=Haloarchaeobius iranensis TaxID=996166 RepID=A0A1G9Y7U8_9EURY|nr:DUF502 domain-containing protein [Haloarchaeobius iranensis]SDN04615.1 Uncharacterized membrane protein [Haloarchaeobius iranensis]
MSSWKRDFASGLIVVLPVLVSAYVIAWLYGVISAVTPQRVIKVDLLTDLGLSSGVASTLVEPLRVLVVLAVFVVFVFSVGYLMRTAVGNLAEGLIDNMANRVPGLRVVYNASKMAAETALGGTDSLQTPVRVEPLPGMRLTAFKTGKTTEDGREVVFLPTAPNITTGFVIEIPPEEIEETDERVEDALTRILSAGFGDSERMGNSTVEDLVEVEEKE